MFSNPLHESTLFLVCSSLYYFKQTYYLTLAYEIWAWSGGYVGGNVYYDGDKLTYITKEGERKEVSIKEVITANESKTAIITVANKQYYVSEEYLIANNDIIPSNVDPLNLSKGIYAIDVVGGVINNFEEIITKGPITVDGRTFNTINDYIKYITESKGGFTKIVYDQTTGDVIFQEWNEVTQKFENVDNSKFSTIVKGNETITTLVDNQDGTYTYTSEDGTTTLVDIPSSVVNQFETIVKQPVEVDGRTFNTINDYIKYVTESKGGFTKIVYDQTTGDVIFQEWNEVTQKFENVDNSKFSTIVKGNETITTLVDNQDGTYTYTSEDGTTTLVDIPSSVVNQFETIVKQPVEVDGRTFNTINDYIKYVTESKGGFTKIVYDQTTGDVIFQEWNEVTQKFENVDNSKFSTIVKGNETITTLVDNQDGTYTYTSEDGTTTLVDIPSSVVNQFETIVKQPVEVDGRTFNTINDYIKYVTESKGGFTKIVYDQTTGDVIFQEWNKVTQKFENVDNSKFSTIVKGNETITLLVPNTNGTFTYYNESQIGADGQPKLGETGVTIDPKEVSVSLNTTTNKYEFKNSQGDVIGEIDANANAIVYNDNTTNLGVTNVQEAIEKLLDKITEVAGTTGDLVVSGGLEFLAKTTGIKALLADVTIQVADEGITNEKLGNKAVTSDKLNAGTGENNRVGVADDQGNVIYKTLDEVVKGNETVTLLIPNTNGTFTYYNESQIGADGQPKLGETGVTIDPKEVSVSLNTTTNKYEFKNSQGDVIGEIDTNAKAIAFDNSTNGFTSTNVQEALEELKTKLDGTSDTLVNNNDGTYTHTTVAGDVVVIDANTTKVEVLDGVYTFKNAKGDTITSIDTNAKAIAFDDSKSKLGADNVQDAIDNLLSKVGSGAGVTLVDNNDGTITLKSDDNTVLGTVSKGSLTNNNDGTYTYDNGDGTPVTFDTNAKAIAFDNSNNGFTSTNVQEALEELKTKLDGTSDTLVNNNDGTYTHTTVAGDVVVIDANTTKVEVLDGVYTFKNAKGDTITSIDTNAKAIAFDDSKSKLGADNVQDAIDNLLSKVGSGAGVTLVDNNDGTITLKSDDNTVLGTVSKGSLTNNNDGTYTYDNGDGTPVTFDTNAKAIAFDNSTNGFTSTNVQEALEELKTKLDGTSDTLVNNNDGTYTHTTVAGDVVIIDANTTKVEVLDGVYTFKNGKGDTITSIDTNAKAIAFDDSKSKLGADNVQDAIDNLLSKVGSGAGVTLVDNNDGTITLKSDDNTVLGTVSKGSLTNNNDGTYTYDNGDGTPVTFDTNAKAIAFDNSTNGFTSTNVQEALEELKTKLDGTSDTLVNNNDGTYTHTTVAGDVVIIDANTTKVEVLDGVYTFKNGKGDTITSIDTNAKAIAFDDSKSKLGADNVQDAIDNLLSKVGSGAGVTLVDNNDGTITLKSDDNTVLGTVSKGSLTNNNDGTYTYDNGDGTPVTFDTNAKAIAFDNSTNGFTSTNVQEALEELKTKLDGTSDTLVNNNDGTYTHTTVAGDVVIIDANTTKVEVLDGVYTFKNGKGDTITSIDTNAKAIAFDDSKSKLGADNVQDAIDNLLSKVGSGAGVTLVDNNDGTITLKSDDNTVLGTVSKGSLTNNNDGTYTYDNGDGTPVTFDTNAKAIAFDNSTNGFTSTNVQEALEELKTKLDGTSDTLVNNNDGTYTHTTVAGDVVVIDANTTKVEVLDGVYTFKNAKGDTITSIDTNAKAIVFDNSNNGFTSTNVQEALEELKTKLDGTSDTLVNNNDGTYTHTTVAGDVVIIDANTTKVEVLDGVYTFKDGKGDTITSIDTNAKAIAFDDSKSKLGADNVQDAIDKLLSKVGSGAGVTLVDNNDGTITLKSDDNTVLGTVSKGSLTNNNDGTYTYDNGDGTPVTFDTNAKAIAFDNSTNGFTSTNVQEALEELKTKLDGTSDTLVNNNDGTYTHTTVAGDVVVIDANTTKVEVLDGVYTFKNAKGDTITSIDTNAKAIAFDNSANGFTSTNVQEALEELKTKLDGTSDTLVNNNDGTYTHTTVAGDVVIIDANTTKVEVLDGVYTFKNAKGDTITSIDTNAKAIVFDNSNNGFTSTNVQEALEELKTTVDNTKGDLSLAGGLEFVTGANGTDKLLADAGIQIADKGITTDKIKPGTDGQILVTEGTGDTATTKWVNKKSATSNTLVTRETAIVSSVNGEEAELILEGDAVLKEGKTVVQAIQGTPVSDTKPSNAQTLIYDQTTQAWIPGTPDVTVDKVVDAKTLTTDGVIVIGTDSNAIATTATKSLLTDVKLNIANNKITTDHIQNGTIKPEDIANAGNNQVLVTDNTGVPTWKNQTDVGEIVTANNGLTKADTNIQLGGLLTKKTAINTTTDNTLALTGLDKKKTQAVNESEGVTQHLLAVDKNGDVIKALKAAMPKFFYMPSVMVPTAESQAQQEGVTYNNTTRTGTIDMYAIYKKQFGSPVMSSTGASALPVLPASELGFHVTYATEGVFTIVSINAEGLMTYKVNDTANVNIGSFINIVFSVNEDN
ncbi:hypothetical protein E0Z07_13885 [Myroides odoratimimus]|uniref:beta strand repeat-containing protein n=1 Tax=Myroides odoratimimus TaxID=76832 RepID=UPI001039D605|nr:hypothetical protein [Myroides odoratimimus]QBK77370.1 hypothetical protein E0Z07_13885 [Myroides odoratimimus]